MTGPQDWDDDLGPTSDASTGVRGDGHVESVDAPLRARPAPPGLSRRDRKAWREIEGERVAAAVNAHRSLEGFRGGFPAKPPKGLGRRGKRSFQAADRANREQWWQRKRDAQGNDQAIGVLVLVLLLVAAVVVMILVRSGNDDDSRAAGTPANPVSQAAPSSAVTTTSSRTPTTKTTPPQTGASDGAAPTPTPTRSVAGGGRPSESSVFGNGSNTSTAAATSTITPPGVVDVRPESATVPPDPGPITAVPPTARKNPLTAAKVWFGVVCGSKFTEPFGARFTATRAALTREAWAYADPARDVRGRQWWQGVQANRETRTCTNMRAARFQGPAPAGPNQVPVVLTADRQVTSDQTGQIPRRETISELRMMMRGTDGLWSVGPVVLAG